MLEFADFELDCERFELRCGNRKVELERMPMELLILLVERRGELVERDEIVEKLWGKDKFVDAAHGINTAIKKIRGALRDNPDQPRFIQTVRGRGYRFLCPVQPANTQTAETEAEGPEPAELDRHTATAAASDLRAAVPDGERSPERAPRLMWVVVAVLGILMGPALFQLGRSRWANELPDGSLKPINSLAVLPLLNLSHDTSKDYFADGLTDELITDLAQISSIRVISHTSVMLYKDIKKPLPEIARELNVGAILEGSVLQSGRQVRITAQLVDARSDRHLWARSYTRDMSDVMAIQTEVAQDIRQELALKLAPPRTSRPQPANVEAYDSYLHGRYFWNRRTLGDLNQSIGYYEQAIKTDPKYAVAYAALGEAYVVLSSYGGPSPLETLSRARTAGEKALQLDATLAEAHTVLAAVKVDYDWDWGGGETEYRRAIELKPGYPTAHHWYALHLSRLGRHAEAEREIQRALELDPLSLIINTDAADVFYCAREPNEAIALVRRSLELEPGFAEAHVVLGKIYEEKGDFRNAVTEFETASGLFANSPNAEALRAHALALSGARTEAREIGRNLEMISKQRYVSGVDIALPYCALEQPDEAMRWLQSAYEQHDKGVNTLRDPLFDECRTDARFERLLETIRLKPAEGIGIVQ